MLLFIARVDTVLVALEKTVFVLAAVVLNDTERVNVIVNPVKLTAVDVYRIEPERKRGEVFTAGADVFVAGSSVFKSESPADAISALKKACE